MDIQAEKIALIQWLAGLNDSKIISRFKALKQATEESTSAKLSPEEKAAIDEGLESVKAGRVKTHEEVMKETRTKFPQLFK